MGAVRDEKDRNTWKWVGGEEVTVSFWNLPGGDENCARFDGSKGWLWSDTNCNTPLNFICQHRKYYLLNTVLAPIFLEFEQFISANIFLSTNIKY